MLRQPRMNDPSERRSDPYWEFGSFGCTGCHRSNLMNPLRSHELNGTHFAFAQGGPDCVRLVHVTPPIAMIKRGNGCEAKWKPAEMPFRYNQAPILINNYGFSDCPSILDEIEGTLRSTPVAKFASKFRSRRTPVSEPLARQILSVYRTCRATEKAIATSYEQALPFPPPLLDNNRATSYEKLIYDLLRL
jgi:hypothetical protein